MENIIYENINEIGDYNKTEDSYFDLSSYIISPLERIILYLNEDKTFINGIELDKFKRDEDAYHRFRERYHLKEEDKVIIGIGLYIERKGIVDFY